MGAETGLQGLCQDRRFMINCQIDFTGSDDFIELTDEQLYILCVSDDGYSVIAWIDKE